MLVAAPEQTVEGEQRGRDTKEFQKAGSKETSHGAVRIQRTSPRGGAGAGLQHEGKVSSSHF